MVITAVPEAEGPICLPYADLADTLKYIPDCKLDLKVENKMLTLTWPDGAASYPTMDAADFPVLPEMDNMGEGSLNGDQLIAAIGAALPYAATESERPVLNGVTVTLGNPVAVAAGDGFRMSHQVLPLSFPVEERIILPHRSVGVLEYVFSKTPRTPPTDSDTLIPILIAKKQVYITLLGKEDRKKARFDFGTMSVIVNLTSGSSPDFIQLIPKEEPIMVTQIFAPQLEASVKRVRAIAKDSSGVVRLEFAEGKVAVSASYADKSIKAALDTVLTQGEPSRFGVNVKYLIEFLAEKRGMVSLSRYTDTGPIVCEAGSPQKILIMPMQVKWGDEPVEEPAPEAVVAEEPAVAETSEPVDQEEATEEVKAGEEVPVPTE
ncbi:MAG: hypothetical protein Q8O55_07400 [Dehalococcoidales bacterium]|nr:hypothetical protein [Dehalococcoidales bacterium]